VAVTGCTGKSLNPQQLYNKLYDKSKTNRYSGVMNLVARHWYGSADSMWQDVISGTVVSRSDNMHTAA